MASTIYIFFRAKYPILLHILQESIREGVEEKKS